MCSYIKLGRIVNTPYKIHIGEVHTDITIPANITDYIMHWTLDRQQNFVSGTSFHINQKKLNTVMQLKRGAIQLLTTHD